MSDATLSSFLFLKMDEPANASQQEYRIWIIIPIIIACQCRNIPDRIINDAFGDDGSITV